MPTEGTNNDHPRARDVARKPAQTARLNERTGDVAERVHAAGWDVCVAVDESEIVFGLLRHKELAGDPDRSIEEAMRPGPSTFRPQVPIQEMADYMTKHDLESSPITLADGTLVGVLFRDDAVRVAGEDDWKPEPA